MKILSLCVLSVIGATVATVPAFAAPPAKRPPFVPATYKLVWREEFDQSANSKPDPKNWGYDLGYGDNGWGNAELQNYVDDVEHARIVADKNATDGKALQITATTEGEGKYTSARLLSKGKREFQYGYIEVRLRIPYGQGIWPAFWMLGADIFDSNVGWPKCGEIDLMENIGNTEWQSKIQGSLHGPGYSGANSVNAQYTLPRGQKFKDGYHTLGLLWEKNSIKFYVDGQLYQKRTPSDIPGKEWAFNRPFFFIANLAVGGNWPGRPDSTTVFPQRMLIDYVRVFQKNGK